MTLPMTREATQRARANGDTPLPVERDANRPVRTQHTTMVSTEVVEEPQERRRGVAAHPTRRTAFLTMWLVVGAAAIVVGGHIAEHVPPTVRLAWWAIALLSIAAELMTFEFEFRHEVYTFTLGEIPLVLGLFLATPLQLIVGRLLGVALFLVVKERQRLSKASLNLALYTAEAATMLGVYRLIGGGAPIDRPRAWLETLVAVFVADLLSFVVVATVVRWHGGPLELRSVLTTGMLTAPVNISLALTAGVLLTTRPWATLLLGGVAAFLVISYRSYSSLTQRFRSLSLLYDFTRLVSGAHRPDVVLQAILTQAKDLLRAEHAEIWLTDERGGLLGLIVDDSGRRTRDVPAAAGTNLHDHFAAHPGATLIRRGRAVGDALALIGIVDADEAIVAPITEAGVIVGLVAVVTRLGGGGFRADDEQMFASLANHASVALANGRLILRLNDQASQHEHESLHDPLTGLPNRVLFGRRLSELVVGLGEQGSSIAVAVMDLDGFKDINDTLGHHAGDLALIEVASRIRRTVHPSVTVARLGGDEFALLFPDVRDSTAVEVAARSIQASLVTPCHIEGMKITFGISIGVAFGPQDGEDEAVLLQRADVAMYSAKSGVGDGVALYQADTDTNTPRRLTIAQDLATAAANGELAVHYQPKVRMIDGEVIGFESLLRWEHPTFGALRPDEFIPIAERTGTVLQLTEHVLRTAVEQLAAWRRQGHRWTVAVNLSMRNLLENTLVTTVAELLAASQIEPELLTLEITESIVMSDPSRTVAVLEDLAALGVRLSVDDFGTGYSSLAYLQRLPVHDVKIDKSFVLPMITNPGADAIVRSILDLARNIGLNVTAEGVEDRATWDRLRNLGCDECQGFFLARAVPVDEVAETVQRIEEKVAAMPACSLTLSA